MSSWSPSVRIRGGSAPSGSAASRVRPSRLQLSSPRPGPHPLQRSRSSAAPSSISGASGCTDSWGRGSGRRGMGSGPGPWPPRPPDPGLQAPAFNPHTQDFRAPSPGFLLLRDPLSPPPPLLPETRDSKSPGVLIPRPNFSQEPLSWPPAPIILPPSSLEVLSPLSRNPFPRGENRSDGSDLPKGLAEQTLRPALWTSVPTYHIHPP